MSFEPDVQRAIIKAVELYFTSGQYGHRVPPENIWVHEPGSGAQTSRAEAFGRKPFDVGIYAQDTIVLFFEVKFREASGRIPAFDVDQRNTIVTLGDNGVDIRYAYNAWNIGKQNLQPIEILTQTHVRHVQDMISPVQIIPIKPAQELKAYLDAATAAGGSQTLLQVLQGSEQELYNFNSMPLMIYANLDPANARVLIDSDIDSLQTMKKLFDMPADKRVMKLAQFARKEPDVVALAKQIFLMKDVWISSNQNTLRP